MTYELTEKQRERIQELSEKVNKGDIDAEQALDQWLHEWVGTAPFPTGEYCLEAPLQGNYAYFIMGGDNYNRYMTDDDLKRFWNLGKTIEYGSTATILLDSFGSSADNMTATNIFTVVGGIFYMAEYAHYMSEERYADAGRLSLGYMFKLGGAKAGAMVGGPLGFLLALSTIGLWEALEYANEHGASYNFSGGIAPIIPREIAAQHAPSCIKKEADDAHDVERRISPIILDLDDDGIETIGANDSKVMFDFDGNGNKNRTGWANSDDGFLVFDRNYDGSINDGGEMFGEHTLKYDGTGYAKDGFEALAQEDSNGDGIIDASDANWQNLKVWRDLNQNGITDEGELFSLDELGIESLSLNYTIDLAIKYIN